MKIFIVLLIANFLPEISGQCSGIMTPLSSVTSCTASSTCAAAAPGYFCFQGACCGVQMNCNAGQVVALTDPQMTPVSCSSCPSGFTCTSGVCCIAAASSSPSPAPTPSPITSCATGQVLVSGVCYSSVIIGAACTVTQQCSGGSFCTSGVCQCPTGFSPLNGICTTTTTAPSCSTGQVLVNGVCLSTVGLNGACTAQLQCPTGATCTNGICVCPTGSTVLNGVCSACPTTQALSSSGQCLYTVSYGASCSDSVQCSYTNGACVNLVCSCLTGFSYNNYDCSTACGAGGQQVTTVNGVCYNVVGYQQACQVSQQCNYGFSACVSGLCSCTSGYTYSGTSCTNGVAGITTTCSPTQVNVNNVCYNTAQLGQACVISAQCTGIANLVCTNSVCTQSTTTLTCATTQVLISGGCYNLVNIGQACTFSQQCLSGSTCISSICSLSTAPAPAPVPVPAPACTGGQVLFNNQCSSPIGNGCINYSCLTGACSGMYPSCRYVSTQGSYFCCGTLAATPVPNAGVVAANLPTCRTASATVETLNGAPKNCVSGGQPCSSGFACEWNAAYNGGQGQYICCGSGSGSLSPASVPSAAAQGQMKLYGGTNTPLQCFSNADCASFPGFANCVQSTRNNAKVCCTTTSCP